MNAMMIKAMGNLCPSGVSHVASNNFIDVTMLEPFLSESGVGGGLMSYVFMMIALVGVMYFLVIRPQNKKLRAHRDMLAILRRGDVITLSNGFIGKIHRVDQSPECIVDLAEGVRVRVLKQSITSQYDGTSSASKGDKALEVSKSASPKEDTKEDTLSSSSS